MSCFRLLPSGHDEEVACSELADNGTDDALQQEEEEYKQKIELEAEERKLEETLEYQRRIENEAKQKHLAEQHKKISKIAVEEAEPIAISDVYLRSNDEEKDVCDQGTIRKVSCLSPLCIWILLEPYSLLLWKESLSFQLSELLCSFS